MMNYFDLEKAQQGHPLITRDGRVATYITYVEGVACPCCSYLLSDVTFPKWLPKR